MKVQSGSEDIALLFLYPRMYVVVGGQRHAPAALPGNHRTGVQVGPRVGLHVCGKSRPYWDSITEPSSP